MEKIIPALIIFFTRKSRAKVENIEYRPKQWVNNLFRFWESLVWKKVLPNGDGTYSFEIKHEMSAWNDGVTTYYLPFTLEAKLAHVETMARQFFKGWKFIKIPLPVLKTPDGQIIKLAPFGYVFAIANTNSASNLSDQTTTVTITSFTISGSNMILIANGDNQKGSSEGCTATINSVSMTQIDVSVVVSAGSPTSTLFGKLAPTTGNIVVTRVSSTGADRITVSASSYSGVSQSTAIGSLTKTKANSSGTTFAGTLTAGTNSWVALGCYISAGGGPGTAGSGTTLRTKDGEINYIFDSNGGVTGSTTLNVNCGGSFAYGYVMVSFDPVGVAPTVNSNFLMFM